MPFSDLHSRLTIVTSQKQMYRPEGYNLLVNWAGAGRLRSHPFTP
jgi:hypothetical protein